MQDSRPKLYHFLTVCVQSYKKTVFHRPDPTRDTRLGPTARSSTPSTLQVNSYIVLSKQIWAQPEIPTLGKTAS